MIDTETTAQSDTTASTPSDEELIRRYELLAKKKADRKARKEAPLAALCSHLPQPTPHARQRWSERMPRCYSFWQCYAASKPITWDEVASALRRCRLIVRLTPHSEYRYHKASAALFVIDDGFEGVKVLKTMVRIDLKKL